MLMLIANIVGLALIALIVWWFWLYKPAEVALGEGDIVVVVENGSYQPSNIKIPANQATEIHFLRKDPSPCAEMLLLPDLEISETLALDKVSKIALPPLQPGEYDFHCQMQMYRGLLKVE
jgi:plastocyanin domain-containing protein